MARHAQKMERMRRGVLTWKRKEDATMATAPHREPTDTFFDSSEPDAPVDAEADRAADRDALAALEVVQHREAVAQYAAARAETQADLSGESLARQYAHGGLRRVSRQRQQPRSPTVYARHIGGSSVAAALLPDIAAEESLGGEDRKTQRADKERNDNDDKRFPNQGEDLLRLCTIIL